MIRRRGRGRAAAALGAGLAAATLGLLPAARAQDASGGGGDMPTAGSAAAGGSSLIDSGPPQPGGLGGSNSSSGGAGASALQPGASLRDHIAAALGLQAPGGAGGPAIQFTPSLGVQQSWTDNALNSPPPTRSAFITAVNPGISISADTERLVGNLSYTPSLIYYEPNVGQNQIAQHLNGNLHATLVPETLFLDLNAFAGQQTLQGGFGPPGTVVLNQSQAVQDYGFTATPYLMHRFGDWGVGELGGTVSQTMQQVPGGIAVTTLPGLPPTIVSNQNMTSTEEHLAFVSGEGFGRWLSNARLSASQFGGTGVLGGGYDNVASYEAGYGITRNFTALATIGWETLHYGGVPPINIDDAIWNVGVQWTPNPDSTITVRYGSSQGITSAFVDASYMPTARTRFTANYSVLLSTDQQQIAGATINNPLNNISSPQVGTPLLASSNFLGLLNGVYKIETATATASLLLDRDTFQITLNRLKQTPLNVAVAGEAAYASLGTYGTVSWQHDLSQAVNVQTFAQYGVLNSSGGGFNQNTTVLVVSATLTYAISPTLNAQVLLSRTDSGLPPPYPGVTADLVTLGLTKTF